MKFATLATIVTATVGIAAAQPHGHSHRHVHAHTHAHAKRTDPVVDIEIKNKHVTVYELNGHPISAAEFHEGVRNGSLIILPGGGVQEAPPRPPKVHAPKPVPAPVKKVSAKLSSDNYDNGEGSSQGVNKPFPDGQLDCSVFPSEYGAVPVNWEGLGGWSGVQQPNIVGAFFDNIMTLVKGHCSDGNCCPEGAFCSYACPPGFQKSQWPLMQGATGQSVGGIQCKGGKLHLTNPSMSNKLCMKGTDKVNVQVKNTMGQSAAVCRTDYPGTESETVPVNAKPGSISALACPDADNYYKWQGSSTSAQYYVNPAGVPVSDACSWGSSANPWGNFAPLNLGVGYSNGAAWLSIFQNLPTTNQKLDYTVELVGDNGGFDNMIGRCKYSNGQYCSGDEYSQCSSETGCTVRVASGTATFVFSN